MNNTKYCRVGYEDYPQLFSNNSGMSNLEDQTFSLGKNLIPMRFILGLRHN